MGDCAGSKESKADVQLLCTRSPALSCPSTPSLPSTHRPPALPSTRLQVGGGTHGVRKALWLLRGVVEWGSGKARCCSPAAAPMLRLMRYGRCVHVLFQGGLTEQAAVLIDGRAEDPSSPASLRSRCLLCWPTTNCCWPCRQRGQIAELALTSQWVVWWG